AFREDMRTIEDIRAAVSSELSAFERQMDKAMSSRQPELAAVLDYIRSVRGKRLRPLLVLLSAGIFGGVTAQAYHAAVMIEMFHTASLVHDDVVDGADMRRGRAAVHVAWSPKAAVLLGDFLLARALQLAVQYREYEMMEEASAVVAAMSEGEMLQLEKAATLDITEEEYYRVISAKTAALLAMCTRWGTTAAGGGADDTARMRRFGHALGMAFQIRDDLFDIAPSTAAGVIGKPTGNDLRERKLTLPVIHALRQASPERREDLLRLLSKGDGLTNEDVVCIATAVTELGGVAYARQRMEAFADEAARALSFYEDRPGTGLLRDLLQYIIHRDC
ncbi:MAG: polyprenyl synthetase family protein, partial [Bacteroidales bacterium]|nr:polyprenyl synthetase family protein [Bacteroidales bacterium]